MAQKNGSGIHSIRWKFTFTFFGVIFVMVMLWWGINHCFLEDYYLQRKQETLTDTLDILRKSCDNGELRSRETSKQLLRVAATENIGIILVDTRSRVVTTFAADEQTMEDRLWENILGATATDEKSVFGKTGEDGLADPRRDTREGNESAYLEKILENNTDYVIQIVQDAETDMEYLELWGILDDGSIFLLRTALESIASNTNIANRFFGVIGIGVALLGAISGFFIASGLTRPILELTEISEAMKQMDFGVKFRGKGRNEISELGNNINDLSYILETTISELKTANNELRRDIREKEEVEKMRQEFISNITHELKTPIALIQGYAEGLQDNIHEDDPDRQNEYCSVIVDEAQKMNDLVKKLLTLNHLEFGRTETVMECFDLAAMIRGYLQAAGLLAEQRNVEIIFSEPGPVWVWADEYLAEEVFANYYSNAVHYAEGEKRIEIRIEQREQTVRVSVFNSGSPIPEDIVPRLWEKFYKADKSRTREYGGSGVGLSIVKAIMELLHQNYGVQNFDNGTAFWFELEKAGNEGRTI